MNTKLDETQSTAIRQLFPTKNYAIRSRLGDTINVTEKYNQRFGQYVEHIEMSCDAPLPQSDEIPLFKF